MFFDLIDADFHRFDNAANITRDRAELMLKTLALHHAHCWGAIIDGKDTSFLSKTNEGASLMLVREIIDVLYLLIHNNLLLLNSVLISLRIK